MKGVQGINFLTAASFLCYLSNITYGGFTFATTCHSQLLDYTREMDERKKNWIDVLDSDIIFGFERGT